MWKNFPTPKVYHKLLNVIRKLPIIREIFKADHNEVVALSGMLNYIFYKVFTHITTVFIMLSLPLISNKHSDACNYLPPYKLDVLKRVEYKFSCEIEAHVEVTTSLMFDCNTFKDKRHLLILVAITLPSKELQSCNFIIQ